MDFKGIGSRINRWGGEGYNKRVSDGYNMCGLFGKCRSGSEEITVKKLIWQSYFVWWFFNKKGVCVCTESEIKRSYISQQWSSNSSSSGWSQNEPNKKRKQNNIVQHFCLFFSNASGRNRHWTKPTPRRSINKSFPGTPKKNLVFMQIFVKSEPFCFATSKQIFFSDRKSSKKRGSKGADPFHKSQLALHAHKRTHRRSRNHGWSRAAFYYFKSLAFFFLLFIPPTQIRNSSYYSALLPE